MKQINDVRFSSLRLLGGTGSLDDMFVQWLQAQGATSNVRNDALHEFLTLEGYANPFQVDDKWFSYLGAAGHVGALPDRENSFWAEKSPQNGYMRRNTGSDDYISMDTAVTFSDNQVLEFDIYPETGALHILSGHDSEYRLYQNSAENKIEFQLEGTASKSSFEGSMVLDRMNHIKVTKESGVMSLELNYVELPKILVTADAIDFQFNSIGGVFGTATGVPALQGIIFDLVHKTLSGTVLGKWAIDSNSDIILDESGNNNNGTVVNGVPDDWGYVEEQLARWIGVDLPLPTWGDANKALLKAVALHSIDPNVLTTEDGSPITTGDGIPLTGA